jgi:hypothetical protein
MDDSQVTAFVNENLISGRILTGNGKTYYTGSRIRGQPTAAVFHPCLDNSSSLSLNAPFFNTIESPYSWRQLICMVPILGLENLNILKIFKGI